jgi:hypothetical protein
MTVRKPPKAKESPRLSWLWLAFLIVAVLQLRAHFGLGLLMLTGEGIAYAGSLYFWPYAPHGRCNGTGRNRGSNGRRHGDCKSARCDRGRVQRVGARPVHRAVRSGVAYQRSRKEKS